MQVTVSPRKSSHEGTNHTHTAVRDRFWPVRCHLRELDSAGSGTGRRSTEADAQSGPRNRPGRKSNPSSSSREAVVDGRNQLISVSLARQPVALGELRTTRGALERRASSAALKPILERVAEAEMKPHGLGGARAQRARFDLFDGARIDRLRIVEAQGTER